MDLTEEFYLQTIEDVFQKHKLALGEMTVDGRLVRPETITDVALLTVEGENDDISGIGQTQAAHTCRHRRTPSAGRSSSGRPHGARNSC